jgi:hypothetical protein
MRIANLLVAVFLPALPAAVRGQCGGEERWAVKMGADVRETVVRLSRRTLLAGARHVHHQQTVRPRWDRAGRSLGVEELF